jgi:hypothetical protein
MADTTDSKPVAFGRVSSTLTLATKSYMANDFKLPPARFATGRRPSIPMAEENGLNPFQFRFESEGGYAIATEPEGLSEQSLTNPPSRKDGAHELRVKARYSVAIKRPSSNG